MSDPEWPEPRLPETEGPRPSDNEGLGGLDEETIALYVEGRASPEIKRTVEDAMRRSESLRELVEDVTRLPWSARSRVRRRRWAQAGYISSAAVLLVSFVIWRPWGPAREERITARMWLEPMQIQGEKTEAAVRGGTASRFRRGERFAVRLDGSPTGSVVVLRVGPAGYELLPGEAVLGGGSDEHFEVQSASGRREVWVAIVTDAPARAAIEASLPKPPPAGFDWVGPWQDALRATLRAEGRRVGFTSVIVEPATAAAP